MEKFYVTWEEIDELVDLLAKQITNSTYQIDYIFGLQECNCTKRKKWLNGFLSWNTKN